MSRFFRNSRPALADWLGLCLFALIYLAAFGAVLMPKAFGAENQHDIVLKE